MRFNGSGDTERLQHPVALTAVAIRQAPRRGAGRAVPGRGKGPPYTQPFHLFETGGETGDWRLSAFAPLGETTWRSHRAVARF